MSQSYPVKTLTQFCRDAAAAAGGISKFGSLKAGAIAYSLDPAVIQVLTAWTQGWANAVISGNNAPALEDMNAVLFVLSYMLSNLNQEGIREWDAGTTYNKGSVVKIPYSGAASAYCYMSIVDANTNNALPATTGSNAQWKFLFALSGSGLIIPGSATNDAAAAGMVGEAVRSAAGALDAASTGNYDDGTSIALTAGDWDVSAILNPEANAATWTEVDLGISTHSGNDGTGLVDGDNLVRWSFAATSTVPQDFTLSIPAYRVSLAAPTTVYLKRRFVFSAGTPHQTGCRLSARRMR